MGLLRTAKAFQSTIEYARLNELWFGPKLVSALWADETIPTLNFPQPIEETVVVGVPQQTAELLDSGGTAHEDLHSTGIAN
jgi:hypothetical protein